MASQATVTLDTGPGSSVSSLVLTNVTSVLLDIARGVIQIQCDQGLKEFDIGDITTFTDTISGGNHTIVISNA